MAKNYGKAFEQVFKIGWQATFPNTFFYRLQDNMNGFKVTSQNPCDFLAFVSNYLFLIELKSHHGASIPFTAIPQYERLLVYKHIPNVYPGVLIWFSEKGTVVWVNIYEMEKMVKDGEKSIGLRMLKEGKYKILVLPSEIKRTYPKVDYEYLVREEAAYDRQT